MGYIDYSIEPQSDIAFLDMKSFYASVECVDRGLHPLNTSLCVMSRADNAAGLIQDTKMQKWRFFSYLSIHQHSLTMQIK